MHPLVDAFGDQNVKVAGYEADDVIATLAGQAREQGIDVTVLTGDRDLFQLIEPGVRVMATGRGVTDTKVYERDTVIERYGIPPELVPDFVGLKENTSATTSPACRGSVRRPPPSCSRSGATSRACWPTSIPISGAKRKQNLTEHADNARISKQLATAVRDVDVEVDFDGVIAARARPLASARDLPRVRAARAARAPRGGPGRGRRGAGRARRRDDRRRGAREVPLAELGALEGESWWRVAPRGPGETPDESGPAAPRLRRGARARGGRGRGGGGGGNRGGSYHHGPRCVRFRRPRTARPAHGRRPGPEARCSCPRPRRWPAFAMARGERPVVAHDWKTIATADEPCDAPPLAHDTMVAQYLIDPGAARLSARRAGHRGRPRRPRLRFQWRGRAGGANAP